MTHQPIVVFVNLCYITIKSKQCGVHIVDIDIYYAKSKRQDGSQPTVTQHVDAVAELACEYGEAAGLGAAAKLAGLMHDFGKYSRMFQQILQNKRRHVDHASGGATLLWRWWNGKPTARQQAIIEAINGHHAGLREYGQIELFLKSAFTGMPGLTLNNGNTPALNGPSEYRQALDLFLADHPNEHFSIPQWSLPDRAENLETMLYTRILFSCLVDADYSVSAWEDDHDYFRKTEEAPLDAEACLKRLYAFRDGIRHNSTANTDLNRIRDLVFAQCGTCGETELGRLFTLTAPTGTGKTLALLHFALRHALAAGKRRIIIVLPFLTLAEQNAAVYERIMPSVLVDHSQSRLPEEMQEFAAKWNAPFIITTSVKFFETLFANAPSDCRKLHNFAQSVVVFDEAQSLPPHLTGATLKAVNELCERYQMTMVFSTATQPDFDAIPELHWKPKEILRENAVLYRQLQRVNIEWRLNHRIPLKELSDQMLTQRSVCSIFNLRLHARTVFDLLRETDPSSAFLLSTDLCPAHRIQVVKNIHERLSQGKPCRVAATQCIEAGVDLDFMALYRALAPLDAIIQAAGRCNRNGTLERGQVIVFEPDEKRLYPETWYQNASEIVRALLHNGSLDIHNPEDIDRYYRRLFAHARDQTELTKAILARDYGKVDKTYRLIPDVGERIIVPYSGMRTEYAQLKDELQKRGITPGLMKQAAPLTITVFNKGDLEHYAKQVMTRVNGHAGSIGSGYWLLLKEYEECYSESGGLVLPDASNTSNGTGFFY